MAEAAKAFRNYMGQLSAEDRAIIALDDMSKFQSARLLKSLTGLAGLAKENSAAQRKGWDNSVKRTAKQGFLLMADAKYHDTPRTIRDEVKEATFSGARFITVHASAGREALKAAVTGRNAARAIMEEEGIRTTSLPGSLLAITVLTSLSESDCREMYGRSVKDQVRYFESLAEEANFEGLVCSGNDLDVLESNLIRVNPGIVLPNTKADSGQQRTATPSEAMERGADYLVFGSAVTKARDRVEAMQIGVEDIKLGLTRLAA